MMRLHIISEVSVADQQLMEACRPKRERKASLKGKEAAEQEPYNEEEAGSRSGKRVAGSRKQESCRKQEALCEHNKRK